MIVIPIPFQETGDRVFRFHSSITESVEPQRSSMTRRWCPYPKFFQKFKMGQVFNRGNEVVSNIQCGELDLCVCNVSERIARRHVFWPTLFAKPSRRFIPLWLRYNWSISLSSSNPSNLVILFDWIDKIFSLFRFSKPLYRLTLNVGIGKLRNKNIPLIS